MVYYRSYVVTWPTVPSESEGEPYSDSREWEHEESSKAVEKEELTGPEVDHVPSPSKTESSTTRPKPRFGDKDVMALFARAQGFVLVDPNTFQHPTGDRLQRVYGELMPWERRKNDGTLVVRYWPKAHALASGPMDLPAEVWMVCQSQPRQCALVLMDSHGLPELWSGDHLNRLLEQDHLELHPAQYRLRLKKRDQG